MCNMFKNKILKVCSQLTKFSPIFIWPDKKWGLHVWQSTVVFTLRNFGPLFFVHTSIFIGLNFGGGLNFVTCE